MSSNDNNPLVSLQHVNQIIHRDIKPDNIGFDIRGDIRLFDFGMARELTRQEIHDNGTFLCSKAGSLRCMAPEVALGQRYNATADVYSFTVVFWQILLLEKPYRGFKDESDFVAKVCLEGVRPRLKPSLSDTCKEVLQGGWKAAFQERLTMFQINGTLRRELVKLRRGDDTGLEHRTTGGGPPLSLRAAGSVILIHRPCACLPPAGPRDYLPLTGARSRSPGKGWSNPPLRRTTISNILYRFSYTTLLLDS